MIIFGLDGTLACCAHRRHFVDPEKNASYSHFDIGNSLNWKPGWYCNLPTPYKGMPWKPNWPAFYEACYQDKPIEAVIQLWDQQISLGAMGYHQIWSGRCESVRQKTEAWLKANLICFDPNQLRMRPIGDNTPDDVLKERWLDETIAQGETIDFVVDDRPKVVRMWRRRGIFVFDVNQTGAEF